VGKLSDEQRQEMLDALAADDADADDFEIEIFNASGEGARVPWSRAKAWVAKSFPGVDIGGPGEAPDPQQQPDPAPLKTAARSLFRGGPQPPAAPGGTGTAAAK